MKSIVAVAALVFALAIPARPVKPPDTARAWKILEEGATENRTEKRVRALHALTLLPGYPRAVALAENRLQDEKSEVRVAAANTLGELKSPSSIPKLKHALSDPDAGVVIAAANALNALGDVAAYDVFYSVLTGQSRAQDSLTVEARKTLSDPGKLAKLGFEQGIGFIPFAGAGYEAFKLIVKDDASPVRAAAALKLASDPKQTAKAALTNAIEDKKPLVRAAAISALAKRGDPAALAAIEPAMDDSNEIVRFNAAAAVIHLSARPLQENRNQRGHARSSKP